MPASKSLLAIGVCLPWVLSAGTLEENRAVMRKAAALLAKDDENLTRFLFVRRQEVKELGSNGNVKAQRSTTVRREPFEDLVITRVIARNDKPLSEEELRQQDARIRSNVEAYRRRVAQQAARKQASQQESDEDLMIREFPDALDFKSAGTETRNGRPVDLFDISPRPGYAAKNYKMRFFEKVRGRCWVDRHTGELLAANAEVFDHVSVGFGLLGKVSKGTEFHLERMEAAPGIWVSHVQKARFDARVLLVKTFRQEVHTQYSELKLRKPERAALR